MQQFREPKPNAIVIAICKFILPIWLRLKEHLSISVQGDQHDLNAFSKSCRAVVLLNHPDRQDPFVVFEIANKMHEDFYCIAARECFDWDGGWLGWLFQRLGCYSVERGQADFHSVATTHKIVREGRHKLLVFPEAEITADESKVHDLHKAIFHIALAVQKELSEHDSVNSESPVIIIPAAIKFSLNCELNTAVEPVLQKMEVKLAIPGKKYPDVFSRINGVVDAYMRLVFDSYGFEKPEASLETLADIAAEKILNKIIFSIGLNVDDKPSTKERLYHVRNMTAGNTKMNSVALRPQVLHCAGIAKSCIGSDLERIERLLIMRRMLLHSFSEIQCCRILDFIESELFGSISPKGWQSCVVSIGKPIEVSSFLELYAESKEDGVDRLIEHFRERLQNMLLSSPEIPAAQST